MLRHQENLYKTINITYHGKYTPYPMLSYGPYDCPLCPVKGLYHMMCNIILLVRGAPFRIGGALTSLGKEIKKEKLQNK